MDSEHCPANKSELVQVYHAALLGDSFRFILLHSSPLLVFRIASM